VVIKKEKLQKRKINTELGPLRECGM